MTLTRDTVTMKISFLLSATLFSALPATEAFQAGAKRETLSRTILYGFEAGKNVPNMEMRSLELPSVDLKTVELPDIKMPSIELPSIEMKSVQLPDFEVPSIELPSIDLKSVKLPDIGMPSIDIPAIDLKSIEMPTINIPGLPESIDQSVLLPAIGVGLAAIVLASAGGGGGSTSSKVDLSIPYDAAARLAYDQWRTDNNEKFNAEAYMAFRKKYEANAIADATSKKLARDLNSFQNKPPEPTPERIITVKRPTEKSTEEIPFFFASKE